MARMNNARKESGTDRALRQALERIANSLPELIQREQEHLREKRRLEARLDDAWNRSDMPLYVVTEESLFELCHGRLHRVSASVRRLQSREKKCQLRLLGYCIG